MKEEPPKTNPQAGSNPQESSGIGSAEQNAPATPSDSEQPSDLEQQLMTEQPPAHMPASRRDRVLGVVRRAIALLLAAGVLAVGIYGVYWLANLSLRGDTAETVQNTPQA